MKNNVLILILLITLSCISVNAEPIRLAVSNIESLGVDENTAEMAEELLQIELTKYPLFTLVERAELETLLQEQQLQLSGVTDINNAIKIGNLLNVKKMIFGTIGLYESEYVKYLITLRLVDIEKGQIEAAESIEVKSKEDMRRAVTAIAKTLVNQIEITGRITAIDEDTVYTTLGEDSGVEEGSLLSVISTELIKDDSGSVIMREEIPVANLRVEKVSSEGSRCLVIEAATDIRKGLTVRKGETELEIRNEKCNLIIKSIPKDARVFIDGKFMGLTPTEVRDIEPGSYVIDIRSGAGYKAYRGKVNLREGRSITIDRELEPEIEVEDIILLGKMPREHTDPETALVSAIVPGFGAVYNGYPGQMPAIMFGAVTGVFSAVLGLGIQEEITPYNYIQSGAGLLMYLSSFYDAAQTADDDFIYPEYGELFMAPAGALIMLDANTVGVAGFNAALLYEGYAYSLSVEISPLAIPVYNTEELVWCLYFDIFYRFLRFEDLFFGLGYQITNNFIGYTDQDAMFPGMLCSPAVSVSYRSTDIESDLILSPYTYDSTGRDNYRNFIGIRSRARFSYFFDLSIGASLSAEYLYLNSMEDSSFIKQIFILNAGIIMRL